MMTLQRIHFFVCMAFIAASVLFSIGSLDFLIIACIFGISLFYMREYQNALNPNPKFSFVVKKTGKRFFHAMGQSDTYKMIALIICIGFFFVGIISFGIKLAGLVTG